VKSRKAVLAALPGLLLLAVIVSWLHRSPTPAPAAAHTRSSRGAAAADDLPRIDLARLSASRPPVKVGRRDIFEFGVAEPDEPPPPRHTPPTTMPSPMAETAPMPPTTVAPRALALNLKYIGSLENAKGLKVAVLLTDRNEVVTGQTGELVANRYKIVRIGFESVEVLDVGSGQTRRIPLKGN
jgi:hypothetical protein